MPDTVEYPQVYSASGVKVAVLNKAYDVIITDQIITDTNGSSVLNFSLPLDDEKQNLFDIEDEIHVAGGIFVIRTIQPGWDSQNTLSTQIYAEAKWYDIAGFDPIQPLSLTGVTALSVMTTLLQNTDWTLGIVDVSGTQDFSLTSVTNPLAAIMSMPPVFGGELQFDSANKTVSLRPQIGVDNGLFYAFGKNLQSNQRTVDSRNLYTRMRPYGANDANNNPITISSVNSGKDYIENYSWFDSTGKPHKVKCYEQTNTKITDPTALKAWGDAILATLCQPKITYTMQVIIDKNQGIPGIGDTVRVYDPKLNMKLTNRVAQRNYNVLQPWLTTVQLSTALYTTASQTIQQQNDVQLQIAQQKSFLQVAVDQATKAITGASGGYVRLNPSNNPSEILIMDTPDIATAKEVWRWDSGGLGHSDNGYNGPFSTAITADGHIVADFMDTGILRAIQIQGVNITGSDISSINDQGMKTDMTSGKLAFYDASAGLIGSLMLTNGAEGNGINLTTQSGNTYIAIGYQDGIYYPGSFQVNTDGTARATGRGDFQIRVRDTATMTAEYILFEASQTGAVGSRTFKCDFNSQVYMNGYDLWLNDSGTTDNHIYCHDGQNVVIGAKGAVNLAANSGTAIQTTAGQTNIFGNLNMEGWAVNNASAYNVSSLEELKQDIKPLDKSALDIINSADIYTFRLKKSVERGIDHQKYGVVIGKDRKTPDEFLSYDKKGADLYNELHLVMKGMQEFTAKIDGIDKRLQAVEAKVNGK